MFIETSVEGVISKGTAPSSGEATILSSTFSIFDSNKWINLSSLSTDKTPLLTEPFSVIVFITSYAIFAYLLVAFGFKLFKKSAATLKASLP